MHPGKDALIHDIDHRTKNTLQIAAAILHMQGKRATEDVRAALSEASSRLVALAAAHNRLKRLDVDNRVRLDEYLAELIRTFAAQLEATLEWTSTPNEGCTLRLRSDPEAGAQVA